jgi:hypothetical protein
MTTCLPVLGAPGSCSNLLDSIGGAGSGAARQERTPDQGSRWLGGAESCGVPSATTRPHTRGQRHAAAHRPGEQLAAAAHRPAGRPVGEVAT